LTTVVLTDGVVTLRPPRDDDAPAVAAAVLASLPTLSPWLPWATPDYSEATALAWMVDSRATGVHSFLVRGPDGRVIGSCGLQHADSLNGCVDLGYWIGREHTGHGYATRSARLAVTHAFEGLGFHRVSILVAVDNLPSQRVVERLDARLEARLTERLRAGDTWHDAYLYALIA
jgi:ribosomal-protein-serine acetyltransferase